MSARETEAPKSGEKILQLLESIDTEPMVERVQKLYQSAYERRLRRLSDPRRALEDCRKALEEIDLSSGTVFDNAMIFAYARGTFYFINGFYSLESSHGKQLKEIIAESSGISPQRLEPPRWYDLFRFGQGSGENFGELK